MDDFIDGDARKQLSFFLALVSVVGKKCCNIDRYLN